MASPKFLVVTNFDDKYDVGYLCAAVNASYCRRWGHHFLPCVLTQEDMKTICDGRHFAWAKVALLQWMFTPESLPDKTKFVFESWLGEEKRCTLMSSFDFVVWIDGDAMVLEHAVSLAGFTIGKASGKAMILAEDMSWSDCLNTGVMLLRTDSKWVSSLWSEAWNSSSERFHKAPFWDQSAISEALAKRGEIQPEVLGAKPTKFAQQSGARQPWFSWMGGPHWKETPHLGIWDSAYLQFANPLHVHFVLHLCGYTAKQTLCENIVKQGWLRNFQHQLGECSTITELSQAGGLPARWEHASMLLAEACQLPSSNPSSSTFSTSRSSATAASTAARTATTTATAATGATTTTTTAATTATTTTTAATQAAAPTPTCPSVSEVLSELLRRPSKTHRKTHFSMENWLSGTADELLQPAITKSADALEGWSMPELRRNFGGNMVTVEDGPLPHARRASVRLWQFLDYADGLPPPCHKVLGSLQRHAVWRVSNWQPWLQAPTPASSSSGPPSPGQVPAPIWESDPSLSELLRQTAEGSVSLAKEAVVQIHRAGSSSCAWRPCRGLPQHTLIRQLQGSTAYALYGPRFDPQFNHPSVEAKSDNFCPWRSATDPFRGRGCGVGNFEALKAAEEVVRLEPGDMLVVPRSWWVASRAETPSLSCWLPFCSSSQAAPSLERRRAHAEKLRAFRLPGSSRSWGSEGPGLCETAGPGGWEASLLRQLQEGSELPFVTLRKGSQDSLPLTPFVALFHLETYGAEGRGMHSTKLSPFPDGLPLRQLVCPQLPLPEERPTTATPPPTKTGSSMPEKADVAARKQLKKAFRRSLLEEQLKDPQPFPRCTELLSRLSVGQRVRVGLRSSSAAAASLVVFDVELIAAIPFMSDIDGEDDDDQDEEHDLEDDEEEAGLKGGWHWFGHPSNWLGAPANHEPVDQVAEHSEDKKKPTTYSHPRASACGGESSQLHKINVASTTCDRKIAWGTRRQSRNRQVRRS